jgi:hypothetical protein
LSSRHSLFSHRRVVAYPRAADDANGAWSLTYVIERLLGRP